MLQEKYLKTAQPNSSLANCALLSVSLSTVRWKLKSWIFQNKYCILVFLFYARTVINKFVYELIVISIKTYKAEDLWQAIITCIFRFKSCNYLQKSLTVSFFLFKLHTVLSFFQLYSFSKENQIRREEGCGTITSNNVVRMEKCFSNSNKQLWRLTEVKQYFFTSGSTVFYTHMS